MGIMVVADSLLAGDLEYVSDDELAVEWKNRLGDIERTKERIDSLAEDEIQAAADLNSAKHNAKLTEDLTIARAKLFYRICRNGGSLRYLLGSSSATQLLKRLDQLKRMLQEGLTARRSCGLKLVEAESRLSEIREARAQAEEMLSMLESALQDLDREWRKRNAPNPELAALGN
jgi:transposase-like protein